MANITIPITLTAGVPPVDTQWTTLAQLLVIIQQYMSGAIIADGQFIIFTPNDPATQQAPLIFNTTQQVFKTWNIGAGRYVPIFQYAYYDVKTTYAGYDTLGTGWVILDGRAIAAIPGITFAQQSVLETLFGVGGSLPTVTPQNISGLPAANAFGAIPWPASIDPVITPASGVIAPGLPFTAPNPSDTEVQAFANEVETLRDSVQDVFDVSKLTLAVAQQFLTAVQNVGTPPLYAAIFVGFA